MCCSFLCPTSCLALADDDDGGVDYDGATIDDDSDDDDGDDGTEDEHDNCDDDNCLESDILVTIQFGRASRAISGIKFLRFNAAGLVRMAWFGA